MTATSLWPSHIASVPLDKCHRLLNHGPTVLVSAQHDGVRNVMSAAWACALDFTPPKVTVVIDKQTRTRGLIEASGQFVLQLPTREQARLTLELGTHSAHTDPEKAAHFGVQYLQAPTGAENAPLVAGCAAWLVCKLVPEPHNQSAYDLFIGEVTQAWADQRVFRDGHWHFDDAPDALRTLHYVAGGQFYVIGEGLNLPAQD